MRWPPRLPADHPDQRGYGRSEKPAGVAAYDITELSADVLALMDALGLARASLVAHDFGGGVAWWVAANHPSGSTGWSCSTAPTSRSIATPTWASSS